MNEVARKLLDKAGRSLAAAQSALTDGHYEAAASRAYYAMFYVAEALLSDQGLTFRKHGGVHGAFGERFAKTGVLDPKYHRWLLAAFSKRVIADYGIEAELTAADAQEMIAQAREFCDAGGRLLEPPAEPGKPP